MDTLNDVFGINPILRCRGTIATSLVNLNALAVSMIWSIIFDTAYELDVSSSSAADDGVPAGTGAQIVRVTGLDAAYNRIFEDVIMNGQTAVKTATKFLRVFSAKVMAAGTGIFNAGDIYILKTGTGGVYAGGVPPTLTSAVIKMPLGGNIGVSGLFTAPAGCFYRIGQVFATARAQAGTFSLMIGNAVDTTAKGPFTEFKIEVSTGAAPAPVIGIIIKPKTDLYVQVIAAAASGIMNCSIPLEQIGGDPYRSV